MDALLTMMCKSLLVQVAEIYPILCFPYSADSFQISDTMIY